jgi:uncharacterized membrane-anchored protein YitT (DUF2179 family)
MFCMDYMIFLTRIIPIVQTIYNIPMFIYAWVYINKEMGSSHILTLANKFEYPTMWIHQTYNTKITK